MVSHLGANSESKGGPQIEGMTKAPATKAPGEKAPDDKSPRRQKPQTTKAAESFLSTLYSFSIKLDFFSLRCCRLVTRFARDTILTYIKRGSSREGVFPN